LGDQREPGATRCQQEQADDDQRPLADAVGESAGPWGTDEEGDGQREQPKPGIERPLAEGLLLELGEEVDGA
jgi:hypothetical protein